MSEDPKGSEMHEGNRSSSYVKYERRRRGHGILGSFIGRPETSRNRRY